MKLADLKRVASAKKTVFLDLDNTIYPYEICHRFALKKTHLAYRKEIAKLSFKKFEAFYRRARGIIHRRLHGQAASHSRLHYFQRMLEGCDSVSAAVKFENIYWTAFIKKMKRCAWVMPFLSFCKKQGIRTGIVTNLTTAIQMRKLKKLGLAKKIDFVVTSEEAGAEKPHPKFVRLALMKARRKSSEILIVGDDPRSDKITGFAFFRVTQ